MPQTYGEKAVGLSFNPANDKDVQEVKELYAKIIDKMSALRTAPLKPGVNDNNERNRMASIAITEAQTAQMWAVKAITYQF